MKKIVILGGGESGVGAALLAKLKGYDVFLSDSGTIDKGYKEELDVNQIEFEEKGHNEERILSADEIVKSPGIPGDVLIIKKAHEKGIGIISEIELAYRHRNDCRIIAITGSNGKTTTTALTYHVCKHANANCAMVGNIGYSFARQ